MDNETDGTNAGTGSEAIAEAPKVETPVAETSDNTAEQQTGADDTGQADEASAPAKRTPWWEKRFAELTAKRHEAEREAAYLRGQLEARATPQQPEPSGPPTLDDYGWDQNAFQQASAQYYAKEAEKAAERVIEARTQAERQRAQQETAVSRLQQGTAKFTDFQDVVSDIPVTEAVVDLLTSNDRAAEILYELGQNPEAMAQFNRLTPYSQAVELGKIAARLEAPKQAAPRNIPPPPPQTVAGLSAGLSKQPSEMSMSEYVQWVKERDKT